MTTGKTIALTRWNGILLSHKKNETVSFLVTWMDPEMIKLSKQVRERQIQYDITYIYNLNMTQMNLLTKQK